MILYQCFVKCLGENVEMVNKSDKSTQLTLFSKKTFEKLTFFAVHGGVYPDKVSLAFAVFSRRTRSVFGFVEDHRGSRQRRRG
jgi:hypothetical protein